ncbi:MAG TPA: DinB family protein [Actinomycetota bacterium]|nr:DinB family protein [Actinomycetota bacterium]
MTAAAAPTRREAIRVLQEGRVRIDELLDRLPRAALTTHGVGGGTWSPKDLIGHLASWEEYALDALAAWDRGEGAPIDDLQFTLSTSRLNDQAVARKASWSVARVRRDADRVHEELLAAIGSMPDTRWRAPATPRGRKPLGHRLGSILVGSGGALFAHDAAHVKSLRSFVAGYAAEI